MTLWIQELKDGSGMNACNVKEEATDYLKWTICKARRNLNPMAVRPDRRRFGLEAWSAGIEAGNWSLAASLGFLCYSQQWM